MAADRCESGQCAKVRVGPDGSVDVWSTRRPGEVTHLDEDELPVSAEVLALLGGMSEDRTEEALSIALDRANATLQRVRDLTDPTRYPGYVDRDQIRRIVQNVGDGGHVYLSTACLHDQHDLCGVKQRERGDESPPHCKYCPAPCVCSRCDHSHEQPHDGPDLQPGWHDER